MFCKAIQSGRQGMVESRGKRPLQAASHVIQSTTIATAMLLPQSSPGIRKAPDQSISHSTVPGTSSALIYKQFVSAWTRTPTKWYPLPLAVGALLLVMIQYRKKVARAEREVDGHEVIRLRDPWQVHVLGALPLRNLSRVWGYLNSLELPIWICPYSLRLYAYMFGCNLDEIEPDDLTQYASLGDFFYRKLKPGACPVDNSVLVSPADGTVLHLGEIDGLHVEQVKGMTYSLDALLGVEKSSPGSPVSPTSTTVEFPRGDMSVVDEREFANVNGIDYCLNELLGSSSANSSGSMTPTLNDSSADSNETITPRKHGTRIDASRKRSASGTAVKPGNALYFAVIYFAPGDYHHFHSPTAWVVEKRRHFVGELFSVSPYMAKRLQNLFVLNERVTLLAMIPVGATNVGGIKINFDTALRKNVRVRPPPPGTYTEAVPLTAAQAMGGFFLGSTIVLVFEAPKTFEFAVKSGRKVEVGNRLGDVLWSSYHGWEGNDYH
ncbi:phosphatidylserine decarboxylase-domain-containing protein [Pisolithus tinctorius]|nr:phosphatidylserine decarboxylase-domain-containing protein [Pisolithus tinctorius]